MNIRALLLAALCLMVFPPVSRAQERGQVGLTMGFPTSAGLIWHATDRIAVRPEITFSQVTSKAELTPPNVSTVSTNRSLGVGASLLWYFGSSDANIRPTSARASSTTAQRRTTTMMSLKARWGGAAPSGCGARP